MKFIGDTLRKALRGQRETITLVHADGCAHHGISPTWAAERIAGAAFTGYGRNGVVSKVVADELPRQGPFATKYDVKVVMSDYPRLPHVDKNPQAPGAAIWAPQPVFANTGVAGKTATVHLAQFQPAVAGYAARLRGGPFGRRVNLS